MAKQSLFRICCAVAAITALGCSEGPAELVVHGVDGTTGTLAGGGGTQASGITLSPSSGTVKVGQSITFTATAPAGLLPLQYGTDRPDLLGLTNDGVATGLAAGTANVAVRSTVDTTQVATATITIQP